MLPRLKTCQPLRVDFTTGRVTAADRPIIKVAHGAIMFLAWGVFLPLGIFIARFTKTLKPGAKVPVWFQYHRIIQSVGLCFALVGFIMALTMVDGDHFMRPHQRLGLAVMIVGLLQPMNALIRPHPQPRTRMRLVSTSETTLAAASACISSSLFGLPYCTVSSLLLDSIAECRDCCCFVCQCKHNLFCYWLIVT